MANAAGLATSVLLICFLVAVRTQTNPECVDDAVRLTIGQFVTNVQGAGRVEVCRGGVWGVVCSDGWNNSDATVVCRQLNHTIGTATGFIPFDFIGIPTPIFLSRVQCRGTETTLLDCPTDGGPNPGCSNSLIAGVQCASLVPECSDGDIRLTDGGVPQNSSGQVEVCIFQVWGQVCDDAWDVRDATVICRELGYNFAVALIESQFAAEPLPILLDEVACNFTEPSLLNCSNDGIFNHDCNRSELAGVSCRNTSECINGDIRLTIGGVPQLDRGQVEICLFGLWGVVCDDGWETMAATVVCRPFGFDYGQALRDSFFDSGPLRSILLDDVNCNENDTILLECQHNEIGNHNCGNDEFAGVICMDEEVVLACVTGDIRLTDGGVVQNSSGQVELCFDGEWGAVCDDLWDVADATVVCRGLGFSSGEATTRSSFSFVTTLPIFLDNVQCVGAEINLLDCSHLGVGNHDCSNFQLAGAICFLGPECSDGAVRLTDGGLPQNSSGQVEVCAGEVWGTVCDDRWDSRDATVVCSQFGFSFGDAVIRSQFAIGPPRPIFLDDVNCNGSEASLLDCPSNGLRNHDCSNREHAGAICYLEPECTNDGAVRLTDGGLPQNSSGQVELCVGGVWGTVCDDDWDARDATVVCRQFGYSFGNAVRNSQFAIGPPRAIFLDDVNCNGSEASLLDCPSNGLRNHDCSNEEYAGVICSNGPQCESGFISLADDGTGDNDGTVQVCFFGQWETICDEGWSNAEAAVVCRQLGRGTGGVAGTFSTEDASGSSLKFLCSGFEFSLFECVSFIGLLPCPPESAQAGVSCIDNQGPQCEDGFISLLDDGTGENDGTVQVCVSGQMETICDEFWTDFEAKVVCRQLERGTGGVAGTFSTEDASGSNLGFQCSGSEASLLECVNLTRSLPCRPESARAGVSCIDNQFTGCSDSEVRIASDGISEQFGRVEVCFLGVWGTVCDSQWDDIDATVVCRELGFTSGVATTNSTFRLSTLRPVFIDSVVCDGTESRAVLCQFTLAMGISCSSAQYAGVICENGTLGDDLERCGEEFAISDDLRTTLNLSESCIPFDERSELCSSVYNNSTSVYVPFRRTMLTQLQLALLLDNITDTSSFEERCVETITRIICHYFFPPCESYNSTLLPTAICNEECAQVQDTCSRDWNFVEEALERANLETINCSSTAVAVSPLRSCCTGAGLQSIAPPTTAPEVERTSAIIGGLIGGTVLVTAIIVIVSAIAFIALKRRKAQRYYERTVLASSGSEGGTHQIDYYNIAARSSQLNTSQAVPNTYSSTSLSSEALSPTSPAINGRKEMLSKISANFVRQLSTKSKIERDQLELQENIGSGEFGVVYKALLTGKGGSDSVTVAVKTLKGSYDHSEVHKIMDESLKMKFFDHLNVLSLIGVCLNTGAAPYIVMPFMVNGSMQSYLRKERARLIVRGNADENEVEDVQKRLTVMCLHIAQGMEYLAEQRFIHRDLAARNCMIDEKFVIKIADFGLTEDVYAKNYFRQEKDDAVKLPLKWLAPESVTDGLFSEKSDVWSYGVTCWEVFSGGKTPYPGVHPRALVRLIDNGERLERPNNIACPDRMFGVMQECWEFDPRDRPTFSELVHEIACFITNLAGYIDLNRYCPFQGTENTRQTNVTSYEYESPKQSAPAEFEIDTKEKHNPRPSDLRSHGKKTRRSVSLSLKQRIKQFSPKAKVLRENSLPSFPENTEEVSVSVGAAPYLEPAAS